MSWTYWKDELAKHNAASKDEPTTDAPLDESGTIVVAGKHTAERQEELCADILKQWESAHGTVSNGLFTKEELVELNKQAEAIRAIADSGALGIATARILRAGQLPIVLDRMRDTGVSSNLRTDYNPPVQAINVSLLKRREQTADGEAVIDIDFSQIERRVVAALNVDGETKVDVDGSDMEVSGDMYEFVKATELLPISDGKPRAPKIPSYTVDDTRQWLDKLQVGDTYLAILKATACMVFVERRTEPTNHLCMTYLDRVTTMRTPNHRERTVVMSAKYASHALTIVATDPSGVHKEGHTLDRFSSQTYRLCLLVKYLLEEKNCTTSSDGAL